MRSYKGSSPVLSQPIRGLADRWLFSHRLPYLRVDSIFCIYYYKNCSPGRRKRSMKLYEYEQWTPCGAVPQGRLGTGLCARGSKPVDSANRGLDLQRGGVGYHCFEG